MFVTLLVICTFLVSLTSLKMHFAFLRWISLILLLTIINEGMIQWLLYSGIRRNVIYYNAFSLADMTVWFIVFFLIHQKKPYRVFIVTAFVVCMAYSLIELLYLKGWWHFHTDSFRLYDISMIIMALMYFYEKLKEVYHNLVADHVFWIAAACFLYHSLLFVTFTTQSQPDYWSLPNAGRFYNILQNTGSLFYYLLLSLSFFICYSRFSRQVQA